MDVRWEQAARLVDWQTPFRDLHVPGDAGGDWFVGGRLNACTNLIDRHLPSRGDQAALFWEGEPGDRRTLTYAELHTSVVAVAEALTSLGIGTSDRVALHVGLLPESIATMLACMRIGATYSVIPAVLPPEALAARLEDLQPRVMVTQDGAWRHGVVLPLKARADEALAAAGSVEHTIVIRRTGVDVPWFEGDRWFHHLTAGPRDGVAATRQEPMDPVPVAANHAVHVSYHANQRGRPTGVVHGTAGLLVYCAAVQSALSPDGGGVMWCPAEFAWLACQTHGILGPLLTGETAVAYEGMLDTPTTDRTWRIVDRYGVSVLLVTPSVVRAIRRWGDPAPSVEQIATLSCIVTAGEAIDSDTQRWLEQDVGRGRVSIANAWGQSELGGMVHVDRTPVADRLPAAGLAVLDEQGQQAPVGSPGMLVLREPWPARATATWGSADDVPGHDESLPDVYVTGDRAIQTEDGIEFLGRADHVFSVSGQLVSAAEVEDVLAEHPFVRQAVVLDKPDPRSGRAVVACVAVSDPTHHTNAFAAELRAHIRETLGGLAQPQSVLFIDHLPAGIDASTTRTALSNVAATSGPVEVVSQHALEAAIRAVTT